MAVRFVLRILLCVWLALWAVFVVRQGKKGQYEDLIRFYSSEYRGKVRHLLGDDLADFLIFCSARIPAGSTYDITGFEKFSIKEVRSRYYLWPLYRTDKSPDFIIAYGSDGPAPEGYKKFASLDGKGTIYVREGGV